jgi:hypothetical protein
MDPQRGRQQGVQRCEEDRTLLANMANMANMVRMMRTCGMVAIGRDVTARDSNAKLGLCILAGLGLAGRILIVFGFCQVRAERNGGDTSTPDKTTKLL